MVDQEKDFDNQFFRMVTVALARTLSGKIRWINKFSDSRIRVILPFYTSLTGSERFCLDAFVDDIVDKRVMHNTDQFQRGMITYTGFRPKADEFANPNAYMSKKVSIDDTLQKLVSKVKAVPLSVNYNIEIQLATSNEVDKVSQKIIDVLFNYRFFNIDYFGIPIQAMINMPDPSITIPREINMENDRKSKIEFSLEVNTYYPSFNIFTDDLIPCDNDGDIDWDSIGIPRPTEDFIESIKKLNEAHGDMNMAGGDKGTEMEGMTAIRKVYFNHIQSFLDNESDVEARAKRTKSDIKK